MASLTSDLWGHLNTVFDCVIWRIALLRDVGSYRSHPLDPGLYCLLQSLDIGLRVKSDAMWEDEWKHHVNITGDHPKHFDVDRVFGSHLFQYILLGQNKPTVVHHVILEEKFSHWRKTKACSVGADV